MRIAIDCGHTLTGADTGAEGCGQKEQALTREIGKRVQAKLNILGYTTLMVSTDHANSVEESLMYRTDKANNFNADLYISIHLNAGGGKGVEVYTYQAQENQIARNILNNIVFLGYTNRGIKGSNLYVINHAKAPAMLIECGFIDSAADMSKFSQENMANAIVKGISGKTTTTTIPETRTMEINQNIYSQLQSFLNNNGFRDRNGNTLQVDGIPGELTLSACPLLKIGSTGQVVQWLQLRVGSVADGSFGTLTNNAVVYYQSHQNLTPDGIVGQNTWRKLLGI